MEVKRKSYIYESPDGGKTIYKRELLKKERIESPQIISKISTLINNKSTIIYESPDRGKTIYKRITNKIENIPKTIEKFDNEINREDLYANQTSINWALWNEN
tara:strand:+ start:41 stop:349 length:309 start_codon:yes stop_codon:yes gene_type:complete